MKNFKSSAKEILIKSKKPLHYKEITKRAEKKGLLKSEGKTPWATMNALISVDIKEKGEGSEFIRTEPGHFALNPKVVTNVSHSVNTFIAKHQINKNLSTKQKGDIAEARVAELITLYGKESLSCYKPVSDDEGIDLVVKRKGFLDALYIQVKSTFGYKERGFVSTVNERVLNKKEKRMIFVFLYFDLSEGDLFEQIFCIPAPKLAELTKRTKNKKRTFTVSLKRPDKSKFAEFMIEKRELANKIIEILNNY